MKLLIKQRVFSWSDTYDVYDEYGNTKYFVKGEIFSLGHQIHVYDARTEQEIGVIRQKLLTFMPRFEVEINGRTVGEIQKKFTLLRPRYEIDYNGWSVDGDFFGWDYQVLKNGHPIMQIEKELMHWGDTYSLDFFNAEDEIQGLMLVIAIDAANCSDD
ncbi:LURP-one-related/scramblase family protein [Anaerosporobacter sp.]